jgi:hypothetical protein
MEEENLFQRSETHVEDDMIESPVIEEAEQELPKWAIDAGYTYEDLKYLYVIRDTFNTRIYILGIVVDSKLHKDLTDIMKEYANESVFTMHDKLGQDIDEAICTLCVDGEYESYPKLVQTLHNIDAGTLQ